MSVVTGDAWPDALRDLDSVSLHMAQDTIQHGLMQAKNLGDCPVPDSMAWVLLTALNQVIFVLQSLTIP